MFEKVLVALDGSEASNRALAFALVISEKMSSEILLVSVVQPVISKMVYYPSDGITSLPYVDVDNYINSVKKTHEKILSKAYKKVKKTNPNLKISIKLVKGRPADKIVEVCREEGCDLIVMGSRGLGGIKHFFLGSVSDRVADKASTAVLIVK